VIRDHKVSKVFRVYLAIKANRECQAHRVIRAFKGQRDRLGLQA
jgi:hypothetical protein